MELVMAPAYRPLSSAVVWAVRLAQTCPQPLSVSEWAQGSAQTSRRISLGSWWASVLERGTDRGLHLPLWAARSAFAMESESAVVLVPASAVALAGHRKTAAQMGTIDSHPGRAGDSSPGHLSLRTALCPGSPTDRSSTIPLLCPGLNPSSMFHQFCFPSKPKAPQAQPSPRPHLQPV